MNLILLVLTILFIWNGHILNCVQCVQKRILEGETDWLNLYNYQVSIQVKKLKTGLFQHGCGGSILSEEFIITAAHCFVSKKAQFLDISNDRVKIVAGTSRLDSGGIYANVDKVFVYKYLNHTNHMTVGDIAIIKLRDKLDVKNDPRLGVIKAPKKLAYDAYVNKEAIVSGFGVRKFVPDIDKNGIPTTKPILSNSRQYLLVKIVSKDKCSDYDHIICSILPENNYSIFNRGICNGDSGGPLVYENTIVGIVSRAAIDCDMRNKTAKYTRVRSYMDFIRRAIKENSDKSDMIILSNT